MIRRKLICFALVILPIIGMVLHSIVENKPEDIIVLMEHISHFLLGFACGIGLLYSFVLISQQRALKCFMENDIIDTRKADKSIKSLRKKLNRIYNKYIKNDKC